MNAVQDCQQDFGQSQQITEVIETKIDQVSRQIHHLQKVKCTSENKRR